MKIKSRLTKDEIDEFFPDSQNHLHAVSRTTEKLFVFTVTPTRYSQVPSSLYCISNPQNIAVQSKP